MPATYKGFSNSAQFIWSGSITVPDETGATIKTSLSVPGAVPGMFFIAVSPDLFDLADPIAIIGAKCTTKGTVDFLLSRPFGTGVITAPIFLMGL
jgi:hypothetical protein